MLLCEDPIDLSLGAMAVIALVGRNARSLHEIVVGARAPAEFSCVTTITQETLCDCVIC